ncbi:MFS transporter [Bifidobacterium aemilianum]|uniref:MFS transporter n=2 Tax=Bifidobacterium aemilianum TaxID=2493120 RepID=A0A366KAD9_9BIFI|nr:MFS transporter [Bifidobacterium aemilianum]
MVIVFITQLDGGALPTMLPAITRSFDLSTMGSSWVVGIYTLGLVAATPITSNLSDSHGRRKVFLWELALWFCGCLISALAPVFPVMLLGRFIQSAGDSGIMVLSMSVLLEQARHDNQGRRVSRVGVIAGLSAMVAPVFSGMLMGFTHSWRAYFLVMLPFLLVLFLLTWKLMGKEKVGKHWDTDYLGLTSFTLALTCLMVGITFLRQERAYLPLILGCLLVSLVSGAVFIWHERRLLGTVMPFLPMNLLRKPAYTLTILLGMVGGMFFSLFTYIPTYVHTIFGLPIRSAGTVMTAVGLGSIIGSWLGGLLIDRWGERFTLVFSSSLIGLASLAITLTLWSLPLFVLFSLALGIAMGSLMSAPLQVIVGRLAGQDQRMQAIGGLSTTKKIGTAIAPLIFALAIEAGKVGGTATLGSYRNMFLISCGLAVLSLLIIIPIPFASKEQS